MHACMHVCMYAYKETGSDRTHTARRGKQGDLVILGAGIDAADIQLMAQSAQQPDAFFKCRLLFQFHRLLRALVCFWRPAHG